MSYSIGKLEQDDAEKILLQQAQTKPSGTFLLRQDSSGNMLLSAKFLDDQNRIFVKHTIIKISKSGYSVEKSPVFAKIDELVAYLRRTQGLTEFCSKARFFWPVKKSNEVD